MPAICPRLGVKIFQSSRFPEVIKMSNTHTSNLGLKFANSYDILQIIWFAKQKVGYILSNAEILKQERISH